MPSFLYKRIKGMAWSMSRLLVAESTFSSRAKQYHFPPRTMRNGWTGDHGCEQICPRRLAALCRGRRGAATGEEGQEADTWADALMGC